MSRRSTVGVLVLGLLSWSGCACTARGALQGLVVDVHVTGGVFDPAAYELVARVDGVEIRDNQPAAVNGRTLFLTSFLDDTGGSVEIAFASGAAGPEVVTLELWRGAELVAEQTYTPDYEPAYPSGRWCGSNGTQARDTLEVDLAAL
ncbi:MAG: hypothetical protein KF773_38155 [Deltaproteobacteria bacterium]|nr:hypothetical protein [Deltaproteobacteria bacterium]